MIFNLTKAQLFLFSVVLTGLAATGFAFSRVPQTSYPIIGAVSSTIGEHGTQDLTVTDSEGRSKNFGFGGVGMGIASADMGNLAIPVHIKGDWASYTYKDGDQSELLNVTYYRIDMPFPEDTAEKIRIMNNYYREKLGSSHFTSGSARYVNVILDKDRIRFYYSNSCSSKKKWERCKERERTEIDPNHVVQDYIRGSTKAVLLLDAKAEISATPYPGTFSDESKGCKSAACFDKQAIQEYESFLMNQKAAKAPHVKKT